jgi:3-oxoacyl-[acyl-carrier protein] reductase
MNSARAATTSTDKSGDSKQMISIDFTGKRVIVTGGSTGIGRGIAETFAKAGADVAIQYVKNKEEAENTAKLIKAAGGKAVLVRGDFRKPAEIAASMNAAVDGLGGKIDTLVNNVGDLIFRVPFADYETSMWDDVLALNLSSMYHATKTVAPHFADSATIVNISSLTGVSGSGRHAFAYAAAKGGVLGFTRNMALELAPRGIRVNCVAPGVVKTPFHDRFNTPEALEGVRKSLPLQRLGQPEDIANAALFLASPLSSFITGEVLQANGGAYFG